MTRVQIAAFAIICGSIGALLAAGAAFAAGYRAALRDVFRSSRRGMRR